MSNYKMNIKNELTRMEYGNINDYLGIIDFNDNFTIEIEDKDLVNFKIIDKIFEENNLVKIRQVIKENGECIITGSKME